MKNEIVLYLINEFKKWKDEYPIEYIVEAYNEVIQRYLDEISEYEQ